MSETRRPRVFSVPPGAPFLPTVADSLLSGKLAPGFAWGGDPLSPADVTIFVPTRRAARELRTVFAERLGGGSVILPVVRPLGEFDEDEAAFDADGADVLALAPPIAPLDRLLELAPLVRLWKQRLPAHVAEKFQEDVVVPASAADAIWLARDLAALIDEAETEGADWSKLGDLVPEDFAGWWQVTVDFLKIVTENWPAMLAQGSRSDPSAHRNALLRAETERLKRRPPSGPVIAAGSTGSIPATADLLSVIARLPQGAVVLPGLDRAMDAASWSALTALAPEPQNLGHPKFGLAKLVGRLGIARDEVVDLVAPTHDFATRAAIVGEAMRPAETSDRWPETRQGFDEASVTSAFAAVLLAEAANEREEALTCALALRRAIAEPGKRAALVTPDRELARRVSIELLRFGIRADDSGGTLLARTSPAELLTVLVEAVLRPGDPVPIAALLKHPLVTLGLDRSAVRKAADTIELVALRGNRARPDVASLGALFESRLANVTAEARPKWWLPRMAEWRVAEARLVLPRLEEAVRPLVGQRDAHLTNISDAALATVEALEAVARDRKGGHGELYDREAGEKLADFLRKLIAAPASFDFAGSEWPDVLAALIAPEIVKPDAGGDPRVSIWGALEARLQSVDTLVLAGLNEGSWPRRAEADRFMSRMMKGGMELAPPERRIGLAAHDFVMAMGAPEVVLTRSARSGDAPAAPSRWMQRLTTFLGETQTNVLRERGAELTRLARDLDRGAAAPRFRRPNPKPPLDIRPKKYSVTEIETLRRDPYQIYARKLLRLEPLEPLARDPSAAERGTLFHLILSRFIERNSDPTRADALPALLAVGRECFAGAVLPAEVEAVWWPRFAGLAANVIDWERRRAANVATRNVEARAEGTEVGATGVKLSGFADRVDVLAGGMADILDFKTGSLPSKVQAYTLIAPQLALEGALLMHGGFATIGRREPADLAYVRLKANGNVIEDSILDPKGRSPKSGPQISEEAWRRLDDLLTDYARLDRGYISRALPFREGDTEGDYDHFARVLEWSAGGDPLEFPTE